MNHKCETCENDGSPRLVLFMKTDVGQAHRVGYFCDNCAEHNNKVVDIDDEWTLITRKDLADYKEQYESIVAVNRVMEEANHEPPSDRYYPYPAGRLRDIFKRKNDRLVEYREFIEKLGLEDTTLSTVFCGAYCPRCKSSLIETKQHVTSLLLSDISRKSKYSIADIPIPKKAYVCISCNSTYIQDGDYE